MFDTDKEPFDKEAFFAMIKAMFGKDDDMKASIMPTSDGGYGVFARGEIVAKYSRARDAKRGALRRGFVLA